MRDMNVMGHTVPVATQKEIIDFYVGKSFTAGELERKLITMDYPQADGVAMRVADRLIQKLKGSGYIVYASNRRWIMLPTE